MSLNVNDAWRANLSSGTYLSRTFNIDPPDRYVVRSRYKATVLCTYYYRRMLPGIARYATESERMRGNVDCDEVFPGIYLGTGRTAKSIK